MLQYSSMTQKTETDWKTALSPEQFHVLREHGTEHRGSSPLLHEKRDGIFSCAGCGQPLFSSDTKYESGTGWPSFYRPIDGAIDTTTDRSHGMTRIEVHCANCGGHLGHVFPDGPPPTRERYCLNSVSMEFIDAGQALPRRTRADRASESSGVAGG
jgi:peptide-methionine (R)-S-oxide reductase